MPCFGPIRKDQRSIMWNYFLARSHRLCDQVMKLMGKHLLNKLATEGFGRDAGAIGALCAEIEAASWRDEFAVRQSYPDARHDAHCVEITMRCGAKVRLAVNYLAGVVLVEEVHWMTR